MSASSEYRKYLYAGVAAAALVVTSSAAFSAAPNVNQTTTNHATVTDEGLTDLHHGNLGVGSPVSDSAVGAASSTSVLGIDTNFVLPAPGNFGTVTQSTKNSGNVRNLGAIIHGAGSTLAAGASASVGATGAVSSFSITGIGSANFTAPGKVGAIDQASNGGTTNTGKVTNLGFIHVGNLAGDGASATATATGAAASVSVTGIDANSFSATTFSTVSQSVTDTVGGANGIRNFAYLHVNNLSGAGTSVAAGATGALASLSFDFINSKYTASSTGNIGQTARNDANVTNGAAITVGNIKGDGASASISAAGALTSVSLASIDSKVTGGNGASLGNITQTASNTSGSIISNNGLIVQTNGGLKGIGSSASISATGAGASFSVASINDGIAPATTTLGNITQQATNTVGSNVTNQGAIILGHGGLGVGASASISAVGASSVASFTAIK